MNDLRGTPMAVGNLEEIIDDQHAIVSTVGFFLDYVTIVCFALIKYFNRTGIFILENLILNSDNFSNNFANKVFFDYRMLAANIMFPSCLLLTRNNSNQAVLFFLTTKLMLSLVSLLMTLILWSQ